MPALKNSSIGAIIAWSTGQLRLVKVRMGVKKGNRMKGSWIVALILLVVSGSSLAAPAWAVPPNQLPGPKMEAEAAFDYALHEEGHLLKWELAAPFLEMHLAE